VRLGAAAIPKARLSFAKLRAKRIAWQPRAARTGIAISVVAKAHDFTNRRKLAQRRIA